MIQVEFMSLLIPNEETRLNLLQCWNHKNTMTLYTVKKYFNKIFAVDLIQGILNSEGNVTDCSVVERKPLHTRHYNLLKIYVNKKFFTN